MVQVSSVIHTLLLLTIALLAGCSSEPESEKVAVQIEQPQFGGCDTADKVCAADQNAVEAAWPLAMKGDYQAQRNIAFAFAQGVNAPSKVTRRPIQACAWRIVIMASGSAKVDQTDQGNLTSDCASLDKDDAERSLAVANLIYREAYGSALPESAKAS